MRGGVVSSVHAWLADGGVVVTASERAARALTAEYHRARRAEGLTAWTAPRILDWQSFAREAWHRRQADGRMVLNALQEQALWARIVGRSGQQATLLEGPRHRMAAMAMEGHRLLCLYAPRYLRAAARAGWQQDARAFSGWLAAFDEECRAQDAMSAARIPLELAEALAAGSGTRAPLLLAGFDRIPRALERLFNAHGTWRRPEQGAAATQIAFYASADAQAELAGCARWCREQLAAKPDARLLVVTQELGVRRGAMERAFLRAFENWNGGRQNQAPFEFSLGIPLQQVAMARGALLMLRWLAAPLEEQEVDWLLNSGLTTADEEETRGLTAFLRAIRRRGGERTRWRLDVLLRQRPGAELPAAWAERVTRARVRLGEAAGSRSRAQPPHEWAELAAQLLEIAGWPGERARSSGEFQATRRWGQLLDACATLGFDGGQMRWQEFLDAADRAMGGTLYAPESQDAPVLIAGPAETAGLTADAMWMLGATEDAWPAGGAAHPLLPLEVQREAGMPHGSAQVDWELASEMTDRLARSAPEVVFSYARQNEGVEARPSRIVTWTAGAARELPASLIALDAAEPMTIEYQDRSRIPFSAESVQGGADVLTAQSRCPFQAFAKARLGAQGWEPAEASLTAAQRGQLLHAVMHTVWSGPPSGIRSHAELGRIADLRGFVAGHVSGAMREKVPASAQEEMPKAYLELEAERLTGLVTEWLRFEAERVPFTVAETELKTPATVGGLPLNLRLDRVDRLGDGSLLVIDYKTGDVSPTLWELPRPDDVQLPLYAGFALGQFDQASEPAGLVFAKLRAGKHCFAGRVVDAKAQLRSDLHSQNTLVKRPFTGGELQAWREYIEGMARDFLAGRAEVNPREYPETCEKCGLQTLCRVLEHPPMGEDEGSGGEEPEDE